MYIIAHELMFMDDSGDRKLTAPIALAFWEFILAVDLDQLLEFFGAHLFPADARLDGGIVLITIFLNSWFFLSDNRGEKYYKVFCDSDETRRKRFHVVGYSAFVISIIMFFSLLTYRYGSW